MWTSRSETVAFGDQAYLAHVKYTDDYGTGHMKYTYRVAGPGVGGGASCFEFDGDVVESDTADGHSPTVLILGTLHNYSGCLTGEGGLERGGSLAARMAKAACRRVMELVPFATDILLQDESYNSCGYSDDQIRGFDDAFQMSLKETSLSSHNMMVHGKTWYMRKMDAEPGDDVCAAAVEKWQRHVGSDAPRTREETEKALLDASRGMLLRSDLTFILNAAFGPEKEDAVDGVVVVRKWSDIYAAVSNEGPKGCTLFYTLQSVAGKLAGAASLRGQVFRIPRSTVEGWTDVPEIVAQSVGAASGGGRHRGGGADADEAGVIRRLVDGMWRATAALRWANLGHV